jgi:peptidoglycan/LPS O-acetylase OafA/YrhL
MATEHRFTALDSLRGISASIIVFVHLEGDALVKSMPLVKNGGLFVDFFFVLSGFVIASSYGQRLADGFSISSFMLLRLGRIFPLHIFVLLLYLPVALLKGGYSLFDFIDASLLLQVWTPYAWPGHINPWNPPSWSISAEVWTYLLFAIICGISRSIFIPAFALFIPASVIGLLAFHGPHLDACFAGSGFLRCLFGFSFGVVCYKVWNDLSGMTFSITMATVIESIAVTACILSITYSDGTLSMLCPAAFANAVFVFAFQQGLLSNLLRTKFFVLLGAWSYSIYMIHEFVMARFYNVVSYISRYIALPFFIDPSGFAMKSAIRFGSDVGALTLYLVILLFSYLTFTLIETPYRERTRRFVARNRARLAAISFVEIVEPEAAKFKSLRSPKFAFLVSLVGIGDRDHRPPL